MNPIYFLAGFIVFLILAIYGVMKWFQIYNGPDRERYRRMLTQGAFAPLTKEDIKQDKQRIARAKAQ